MTDLQNPIFKDLDEARQALKISDRERMGKIMEGIEGKRLTYRRIGETQIA
jgi:hypothetical protein